MTHFVIVKNDKELLGHDVPYLSAIGAFIYLANCIRPNITFSVNLLARLVPLQLEDIGIVSNIYYVIFVELLI